METENPPNDHQLQDTPLAVKLWQPNVVGSVTLLCGPPAGFALACINWWRMGLKRKAKVNLVIGLILTLVEIQLLVFLPTMWGADLMVMTIATLAALFTVVLYLYKQTEKDLQWFQFAVAFVGDSSQKALLIGVLLVLCVSLFKNGSESLLEYYQLPRLRPTSQLVAGSGPSIEGIIHPWTDEPITGRHIVLCGLITETFMEPYDCILRDYAVQTDEDGHFQFDHVLPGKYLVFYGSGAADFESAMDRWGSEVIRLGTFQALGFFSSEPTKTILLFVPNRAWECGFWRWMDSLTLMAGRSPFFVAHDMEWPLLQGCGPTEKGYRKDEDSFFQPVIIEVKEGYTSQVEFDVEYWGQP